ncbi:MAG: SH3 domain-containing protein, partial [Dehalococcoidia bacterium]
TNYDVVGTLPPGQNFEIVGRNADSSWWQVSTPNGLSWVFAKVVTTSNVDDTIPVVEIPSSPENTLAPTNTVAPESTTPPSPTDTPIPSTNTPQVGPPPGSEILADGVWRCPNNTAGAAYVGSDKSDKFHYLNCSQAQKIKDENRICFSSKSAAIAYKYIPCGVCNP